MARFFQLTIKDSEKWSVEKGLTRGEKPVTKGFTVGNIFL